MTKNLIEVRIDGKHTTMKVDGHYWGYDSIDDRAWHVTGDDVYNYPVDDLMEMVTVITNSMEYVKLLNYLKDTYPNHELRYYKS